MLHDSAHVSRCFQLEDKSRFVCVEFLCDMDRGFPEPRGLNSTPEFFLSLWSDPQSNHRTKYEPIAVQETQWEELLNPFSGGRPTGLSNVLVFCFPSICSL